MSEFGEFIQEGMDVSIVGGIGEPKVCVVGCGGAGNNVVEGLYWDHPGVETIALNDNQDRLSSISCSSALLIRPEDIDSVEELYGDSIRSSLSNSDIVFVVVGLGGAFGSRVAPVVSRIAKEMNLTVLSVGIQPFAEEMRPHSESTLEELKALSDAVIVIDNNKLTEISEDLTLEEGFKLIQNGISKIITTVCQHITDQIASYLNSDIAEEIRFDLQSMSDSTLEPVTGHAVTGAESAFMQASLFSVEGPFFNFQ
jgi:cell division protein FtsZ